MLFPCSRRHKGRVSNCCLKALTVAESQMDTAFLRRHGRDGTVIAARELLFIARAKLLSSVLRLDDGFWLGCRRV